MHAVGAGLEALGEDIARYQEGPGQLGVILCVMSGSVNYSRRFYDEVLKDPGTASPLVFPETVFNSPASHLAAVLGVTGINYTLVGDPGTFLQGLALAADWLLAGQVEGCLVIGAEEIDWLTTEACYLFERNTVVADGAGALYLRRQTNQKPAVRLRTVTQSHLFSKVQSRAKAAKRARAEIVTPAKDHLLCDGIQGMPVIDRAEKAAWSDWPGPRVSPKLILGEGLMAGAAWQCVAAFNALQTGKFPAATVSVVGSNQQAIAAQFVA
jgi:3-oxoacyl-(acyl-carrier-protein) synthase